MAKSKNRRKSGVVKAHSGVKRMRKLAAKDIKDFLICSVIDRDEDGTMRPRTVYYNTKLKRCVKPNPFQGVALTSEPWRWNSWTAVVCRKQDGTVYLDKQRDEMTVNEHTLMGTNSHVTETLFESWEKVNSLHALTWVWVLAPYDMGDKLTLDAVLAPVWYYEVLGHMLTKYEQEKEDHVVMTYHTNKLDEFVQWFVTQDKHRAELDLKRSLAIEFIPTGVEMKAGELQQYRALIQKVVPEFKPKATVSEFAKTPIRIETDGWGSSKLMSEVEKVPPCLNARVTTVHSDGREHIVIFQHNALRYEDEESGN